MANLLLTYTVLNASYLNGKLESVTGDPGTGNLNVNPPADTAVPIDASIPDPKIFSYAYGTGGVRFLLAKLVSKGGVPASSCTYTLLGPSVSQTPPWPAALATDITLQYGTTPVATNPYGVAHVGGWLYIVDYESRLITRIGDNALNGLTTGSTYTIPAASAPFDVGDEAGLSADAKGVAIIALNNYLFALYIVNDSSGGSYQPSVLVRMTINPTTGALAYDAKTNVGMNATEIIPVAGDDKEVTLLIPAIGGYQQAGATNGTNSNITYVPPLGTWPASAPVLITGDTAASAGTFDIRAIAAASAAGDDSLIFILTGSYDTSYNQRWTLYQTTVDRLLSITTTTPPTTLSAQTGTGKPLGIIDSGASSPGYFWDIFYENNGAAADNRLWFLAGSPILVTAAANYGSPTHTGGTYNYYPIGTATGQIGGQNVNSVDLTAETLRQSAAGVSLKRGLRGHLTPELREAILKAGK